MYVKDLTGKAYPCQLTHTANVELNGNIVLNGTFYPSKVNKLFMEDLTEMWTITDFDDVEYRIVYASKRGEGIALSVDIRAIPLFFDELDTSRIYEEFNEHMPANVAFGRVFEDTDFTYALVDSFDAVQWEGFGAGESKLETFKRCLERYQAEFKIVGHIVYLYKLVGRDTQFQYRHRLNASNIVKEIDATALYTYAKGYGNYQDGDDWQDAKLIREYTSPIAQIIGIRHAPPIKDGRVTNAGTMDRSLKALVDESLKISITADIHDLRKQGYPLAQPEVGDRVFVIDERIDLLEEVRVTNISITKNWKNEIIDLNVTFGSEGVAKRHQSNLNTAIKDFTAIMGGKKKLPMTAYDNAVIGASEALKRMQSELKIPENGGLMAIDKNNPNNVVVFNAAGIGVSTDGGATFGQAMTGQGINASYIATGTLDSSQVLIRGGSETEYALFQGNEIETRGKYTRTWFGETTTHDVGIQLRYGRLRFHNYDSGRNLYFSETGISTYIGGSDNEEGESSSNYGSGTIEFFSYRHNSVIRGLTMYSNNGVVALESEQRNIVIAPRYSTYAEGRKFSFDAKDVTHEGYIVHGNSGIRFSEGQTSGEPLIHATNANGDLASGSFYAQSFYGDLKPRGAYAYVRAPRLRIVNHDTATTSNYGEIQLGGALVDSVRVNDEGANLLLGASSGEVRAMNNSFTGYRPFRGSVIHSESKDIDLGTGRLNNNGTTTYVQGDEVRATRYKSSILVPMHASTFNQGSSREYKTNIIPFTGSALEVINDLQVVTYNLKDELARGIDDNKIGFISEDSLPIATRDSKGIEGGKLSAYNAKAIQEIYQILVAKGIA